MRIPVESEAAVSEVSGTTIGELDEMPKRWLGLLFLGVWLGAAGAANAALNLDATTLDFGSVVVGRTPAPTKTATLSSDGGNFTVTVAVSNDAGCSQFRVVSPTAQVTVTPGNGNEQVVTIRFTPTSRGDTTCTINVLSSSSNVILTLIASGNGQAPQIAVSRQDVAFGPVDFGQTSDAIPLVATNNGDIPLTITSTTLTTGVANFVVSEGPSAAIPSGGTFTWNLQCRPSARGNLTGTFEIVSDSVINKTVDIALSCTGIQGNLTNNRPITDFGAVLRGTMKMATLTLSNPGNVAVTNISVDLSPANKGYTVTPSSIASLAAGQSTPVAVAFLPVDRNSGGTQVTLTFTGTWGTARTAIATSLFTGEEASYALSAGSAMLDFGSFRFDARPEMTFRVGNDGNATLPDMTASFVADNGTKDSEVGVVMRRATIVQASTAQIAKDEMLDITVTPQVDHRIGLLSGHIDVTSATVGGLVQVPVTGTAIAADVKIPAVLDFGVVAIDAPAANQVLTIENTGNSSIAITSVTMTGDNPVFAIMPPATPAMLAAGQTLDIAVTYKPMVDHEPGQFDSQVVAVQFTGSLSAQATVVLQGSGIARAFSFRGGGVGCAASDKTGGVAALLVMLAVVVVRRRRRAHALAALVLVLAISGAARADDVLVGVYQPTPATHESGFQLESPEVGAPGSWVATSVASYASNLLVLHTYHQGERLGADRAIQRRTMVGVGGAYAFLSRFEAGLWLPMYMQRGDEAPASQTGAAYIAPASGTALGDLTLHGKVRLVRFGSAALGAAVHVTLPTASSGQFTGVDLPTVRALGLAAWAPWPGLTLSASAGGVVRKTAVYRDTASISQGSGVPWGAGVSYRMQDRWWASAEVFGELARGDDADMTTLALAPIEGLVGARYRANQRVVVGMAIGRGLSDGIGAPAVRGVVTLAYEAAAARALRPAERSIPERDSDGDGVIDRLDRCPQAPEDRDGFQDDDGCPDPDTDNDGIADAADKCPNQVEDKDGFQDDDGCPDPDNDGDGIADAVDRCPGEPETMNGKDDDDGCPDTVAAASVTSPLQAAEAAFARGRALMAAAKYAKACEAFQQSQRLDPQFGTQYNIAGCSEKIGQLATAWALYRQLARSDTNPTRRGKSEQLAAALASRVPRLRITLSAPQAGVHVTLNGADASALVGVDAPVDLGRYTVAATATGYRAWQQTFEIAQEGQLAAVTIQLQPVR